MAKKIEPMLKPIDEILTFWDVLTPDERQFLRAHHTVSHFKKNEVIHFEGEKPSHMMILAAGKVKVYKEGVGNRPQIIRMLKVGEHFGYRAILASENYNTNVAAFEPSVVYMIKAQVFISVLKNNNAFCYRFLEEVASDLGASDARAINLTQKHIRGRLADALLTLRNSYGYEEDESTINIYLSREDLASFSNMTTSNAIRTLSGFVNERIIAIDGRRIKIFDEEKLVRISKMG